MHLSKVKHSKFNESGQLAIFYAVSAAWGIDLIIRVCCVCVLLLAPVEAWLSGRALVSINDVTLHRARLVLGWVSICGRVNHLDF